MILVFGSSIFERDFQNDLLVDVLEKSGKEFIFLNPLRFSDCKKIELKESKTGIDLYVDGRLIQPSYVYMSRLFRHDCMIDLPRDCRFPTLMRSKIAGFFDEICFALKDSIWVPGNYEAIRMGDAKISLMNLARSCGLIVPTSTLNSFSSHYKTLNYRKVLGPPFMITLNTEEAAEVAVTLVNSKGDHDDSGLSELPWQWQTLVNPVSQVRCVLVKGKIRSYKADIDQFEGKSMREAQGDGRDIVWDKYALPNFVEESLFQLSTRLGLSICCPEFLIDAKGRHIFIDLNPCGDWYGFLNEEESYSIAMDIVQML
jgi:hypothetical protein